VETSENEKKQKAPYLSQHTANLGTGGNGMKSGETLFL
jgi:hypothetical protein